MSFQIDFLGLIYFFHKDGGRLVLLPDGRDPEPGIPKHYASFFLEKAKIVDDSNWWTPIQKKKLDQYCLLELPISAPSKLTITGLEPPAATGCWPFGPRPLDTDREQKLPELKRIDPTIEIVPDKAKTIAQLEIHQGRLETFLFRKSVVTRLTVPNHSGPITITASGSYGEKTLTLFDETEIVFSNTSDLIGPDYVEATAYEKSHFRIYANLAVNGDPDKLKEPDPPELTAFPSSHPYLRLIPQEVPAPGCSNTCC